MRNTADCQADVERFIRRIITSETVWYMTSANGAASCDSNTDGSANTDDPGTVLLFFSDEAYARRAQHQNFPDHTVTKMDLFDFLYRWLPGMTEDGVFAGPNWSGDLVGLELEAFPLREQIESVMTSEHRDRYAERYREFTGGKGA